MQQHSLGVIGVEGDCCRDDEGAVFAPNQSQVANENVFKELLKSFPVLGYAT